MGKPINEGDHEPKTSEAAQALVGSELTRGTQGLIYPERGSEQRAKQSDWILGTIAGELLLRNLVASCNQTEF